MKAKMTSLLEIKNITFAYGGNTQSALQNFSVKIPIGKRCALLGHNGSGKSTVLLLANGLLQPHEGKMLWKGELIEFRRKYLKEFRQKTGLLFQNADEMLISPTVLEDISYGLINAGYKGEALQHKVEEILNLYQLDSLKDRPIHHLSLGEKRRVALAGIMGLEPELLLLDEPTTYLDPSQTEVFLKEMNRIHHSGTTVVMSTHDLDLAYEWADWIFVIESGQLIFEGTPDALFVNERFVHEKGLTIPLFFHLKKLLRAKANFEQDMINNASKEEILLILKGLLEKKGDS